MVKIAVAGCAGRMGNRIIACLEGDKSLVLAAGFEAKGHPAVGGDIGLCAGLGEKGIAVSDSPGCAAGCAVMVDFTVAQATLRNLEFCVKNRINMVIGTTGLPSTAKKAVRSAADRIAVVMAPNMGVGVNVLLALVRRAAEVLGPPYDIEVIEAHHNQKKDAPSGTALALARAAAEGRKLNLEKAAVYGRSGMPGPRKKGEIGIHAIRGGDIIGEHTVLFAGPGEKIEMVHSVVTRDALARGAVRAAAFVGRKKKGLFTMQDVLGL